MTLRPHSLGPQSRRTPRPALRRGNREAGPGRQRRAVDDQDATLKYLARAGWSVLSASSNSS
jgi:hypothetical protein